MKKILLTLCSIVLVLSHQVSADISEEQQEIIDMYAQKADEIIQENGENHRSFILYILKEFSQRNDVRPQTAQAINEIVKLIEQNTPKLDWGEEFTSLNIDIQKVKQSWLDWINAERENLGLTLYTYELPLEKTALLWSNIAKKKGYIDHKVSPSDGYYEYYTKAAWMQENGVVCKNISRMTFSESIAWGTFSCSDDECSDELINAIKSSFNFFMSEKGKTYKPHYEAIAAKLFQTMGLGIALEKTSQTRYKYYLTNHYCTTLQ